MAENAPDMVAITQVFEMHTKHNSLQLCRGPDGRYIIVAGDLRQPNGGMFVGGFWARGDLKQLRNALSRELADG